MFLDLYEVEAGMHSGKAMRAIVFWVR